MADKHVQATLAESTLQAADYDTRVRQGWAELQRLSEAVKRPDVLAPLRPVVERFELGIFRLVVMGEIKKGKSSFLNALLGEPDLLPTASDVATSTVYKVLYGPEKKFKVFFLPDVDSGKRPPPLAISADQVAVYGTEAGNPGNRQRVDFIGVELPHPLLQGGLVLVDTPGVGGLFKAHRDITWKYAPNADAIFFVLDSVEALISDDEIQFLRELTSKVTQRVYFVQTKTDIAGTEQWQAWRDRNVAILTEKLGMAKERLVYFPVSAKLKAVADKRHSGRHLTDSGFLAVLDFLHRGLMQAKHRMFAGDLARRLLGVESELRRELSERQRILQSGSREELDRIDREYRENSQHFEAWQRTTFVEETRTFALKFADLKRHTHNRLQDALDPAGSLVTQILDWFRKNEFDPQMLNEMVGQMQQECLARASEVVGNEQSAFNRDVTELVTTTTKRLAEGLNVEKPALELAVSGPSQPITIEGSLGMHFSKFEEVRTSMYGGIAGAMIANIGAGLLAFVFPPAAAIAGVASLVGAYIGSVKATDAADTRRREEAIAKLGNVLANTMRQAQRHAINQFNEMAVQFERHAETVLRAAADGQKALLQTRLRQIEETRSRSREENQNKVRDLETTTKALQRVRVLLIPVLPNSETK